MSWQNHITATAKSRLESSLESWARWSVDPAGVVFGGCIGYGKGGHQRLVDGVPTGSRTAPTPTTLEIEADIERALWRYQEMDGFSKRAMDVEALREEYLSPGSQGRKAENLRIGLATYKRRLSNVKAYLLKELFEKE